MNQKVSNLPQCGFNIEISSYQDKSILSQGWITVSTMYFTLHTHTTLTHKWNKHVRTPSDSHFPR